MNILLADDHSIVRSGLRLIILDAHPEACVGEVGDFVGLKKMLENQTWQVLVLDIALGDRNGLDLIPEIQRIQPDIKIMVLSMYSENQFVLRALRAGVYSYVTKDRAPEELLQGIHSLLQGKKYFSQDVSEKLADFVGLAHQGNQDLHQQLSPREYEVFLLLANSSKVSEIAERLCLSVKTISTYRTRILEKMGMSSNTEMVRYALQHGLIL